MIKKYRLINLFFILFLIGTAVSGQSGGDYPLLSQGALEPPPPPPGYNVSLPPLETFTAAPPPPPPPSPPAPARRAGRLEKAHSQVPVYDPSRPVITPELATLVARLVRSLKTGRTLIDKPENELELRRVLNTGRICANILGLERFPAPSKFMVSPRDRVLRDRSYGAVEYRFFGDFDNRINGWVKPIETAVYLDLVFDGRNKRRSHIRSQFTRTGPMTGYFYAYSWDAHGNPWKMQGSLDNIFVRDDGLPSGGVLKVFGADPAGRLMKLELAFPVTVLGETLPAKKDTRHREGQRVSIGN